MSCVRLLTHRRSIHRSGIGRNRRWSRGLRAAQIRKRDSPPPPDGHGSNGKFAMPRLWNSPQTRRQEKWEHQASAVVESTFACQSGDVFATVSPTGSERRPDRANRRAPEPSASFSAPADIRGIDGLATVCAVPAFVMVRRTLGFVGTSACSTTLGNQRQQLRPQRRLAQIVGR